jgi:hypothetical protein
LGLEIKEIHRVLEFQQEAWMKPYIEFNTEMRKKAKTAFEKNFYKLMNNSVFGEYYSSFIFQHLPTQFQDMENTLNYKKFPRPGIDNELFHSKYSSC